MSIPSHSLRPLAFLRQVLRQCRAERQPRRLYATIERPTIEGRPGLELEAHDSRLEPQLEGSGATTGSNVSRKSLYPSLEPKFRLPPKGFRPSQAIKQNRPDPAWLDKIPVFPPPRSTKKLCPDPVRKVNMDQIAMLDPTGARTRLFSESNPDCVQPGDILYVRLRNENPVSGVCLSIRQRHHPVDTAVLLRNQLTRIGVEMWVKVYSPNVEGIEIVQRKEKRARRARLYYMRQPRHDAGSLEGVVRGYLRQKAGPVASASVTGRNANAGKKKSNKR